MARLVHGVAPEVDLAQVDPDALLQESFDLDSMGFLTLVTDLYREWGIDVPEDDYPELATLNGLVRYFVRHRPTAPLR